MTAADRTPAVGTPRPAAVAREVGGFLAAGAAAYATDLLLFALLRGGLGWGPVAAKTVSSLAACGVAYLGNRFGPYRGRGGGGTGRSLLLFLAVQGAATLVQLCCLAVSHYLLGLTSPTADTLSANVVGMALATLLRFWGFRSLVFTP